MPKISNKALFNQDSSVSLEDFLIGTDEDNNQQTRTYTLDSIHKLFNSINGYSNIIYRFSDGTTEITHTDTGYFTTENNETDLGEVSAFYFNKTNNSQTDLTELFDALDVAKDNVVLRLFKPGDENVVGYYSVSYFLADPDDFYILTVTPIAGFATGVLVNDVRFGLSIAVNDVPQSDWEQEDDTQKDFIQNKPTIPDEQIQSDWEQEDDTQKDFIQNKPTIPDEQIQSDWEQEDDTQKDFIQNKPTIPDEQIQSDWEQEDDTQKDFIQNKPTIPRTYHINRENDAEDVAPTEVAEPKAGDTAIVTLSNGVVELYSYTTTWAKDSTVTTGISVKDHLNSVRWISNILRLSEYFVFDDAEEEVSVDPIALNDADVRVIKATYNSSSEPQNNIQGGVSATNERFTSYSTSNVFSSNGGFAVYNHIFQVYNFNRSTGPFSPEKATLEVYLEAQNGLFSNSFSGGNTFSEILLFSFESINSDRTLTSLFNRMQVYLSTNMQNNDPLLAQWSQITFDEITDTGTVTQTQREYYIRDAADSRTFGADELIFRIKTVLNVEYADPINANGQNNEYVVRINNFASYIEKIK